MEKNNDIMEIMDKIKDMKIELIEVDKLIPYERNNKIHDETQVNRIANSIKEFWFTTPILLTKENIIINWHWRLEWAKKLWMQKVPCIIANWLTDKQIKKLRILDNKLNESERNLANLKTELDDLDDFNFWNLEYSTSDLFPEFDAPEFNPDDYPDWFWFSWNDDEQQVSLTVYVKDDAELEMLKNDLKELWYTNYK